MNNVMGQRWRCGCGRWGGWVDVQCCGIIERMCGRTVRAGAGGCAASTGRVCVQIVHMTPSTNWRPTHTPPPTSHPPHTHTHTHPPRPPNAQMGDPRATQSDHNHHLLHTRNPPAIPHNSSFAQRKPRHQPHAMDEPAHLYMDDHVREK